MNIEPPLVVLDGHRLGLSPYGGALRYLSGLADGLVSLGVPAVVLRPSALRARPEFQPRAAPLVVECPDAAWWLTDIPERIMVLGERPTSRALFFHDVMAWEVDVDVPAESCTELSLDQLIHFVSLAHLVVAVSGATAAAVAKLIPGCAPTVVRHGVTGSVQTSAAARPLSLLHVGGRSGYKDFDILLRALAVLRTDGRAWTLMTIGGPREWSPDERWLIDALGVGPCVRSRGWVSDDELGEEYATCSVVVSPSRQEGFGLAVLEGLVAGKPVVAADIPVVHEVGEGMVHTFKPRDAEDLARAVRTAIAAGTPGRVRPRSWTEAAEELKMALDGSTGPHDRMRRRRRYRVFHWP